MTFEKLHEDAIIPQYQTIGSAGLDLHSIEATIIEPGKWSLVGTGLRINLPGGTEGQVRSRSGLAAKHGISVLNSPGTIDEDYKGELKVILYNAGDSTFSIEKGDRIAQLVVAPVYKLAGFALDNEREDKGFGSTGL
jgi:dUTP pyrophosphatase